MNAPTTGPFIEIRVSGGLLTHLLSAGCHTQSNVVCTKGLPIDAKLVTASISDVMPNPDVILIFTHPSFAIVNEGEHIPMACSEYGQFADQSLADIAIANATEFRAGIDYGKPVRPEIQEAVDKLFAPDDPIVVAGV